MYDKSYRTTPNAVVSSHSIANLLLLQGTVFNSGAINESYLRGRQNYNGGRMLQINLESDNESGGNTGDLLGLLVLGICTKQSDMRFIIVHDRSARTMIPLIEPNLLPGSLIWTDE